jgi:hypothetical protein
LSDVSEAIDRNDLDELIRIVDALCATREWDGLVDLRDRARRALDTGRQLWPAASLAEYRLALEAPAPYAAQVLVEGTGRFAPGPLPEVAASTHTWAELAPHVNDDPIASIAAYERVTRGEPVDPASVRHAGVLAAPLVLARWEAEYEVATYYPDRVDAPAPALSRGRKLTLPSSPPPPFEDPDVEPALRDVVRGWTATSEGTARVVCVQGDAAAAIAALDTTGVVRSGWLDPREAHTLLAWVGASGGRHGRRRGTAAGRDLAWAAAAALAGYPPGDLPPADALGAAVGELGWYAWQAPDVSTGWILRIAVEDATEGLAWAIDAVDR